MKGKLIAGMAGCAITSCISILSSTISANHDSTAAQAATPNLTEASRLTTNGIGGVEIGMSVRAAEQASGLRFNVQPPMSRDGSCNLCDRSRAC